MNPLCRPVIDTSKYTRNGVVCGYHTAPLLMLGEKNSPLPFGGISELERAGVWFSHWLVGCLLAAGMRKGKQRGTLLPFSILLAPCHPDSLISMPTSLKKGRGSLCDVVGLFVGADVAAGGAFGGH